MGLYVRPNSPYFWTDVSPPDGGPRIQKSTKIRHDATTPQLRKENRQLAERVYHERYAAAARRLHGEPEPKPASTFAAFAEWYERHVTVHHRGAKREREILKTLTDTFGKRQLRDLSKADVQEWVTERRDEVSAATVNRELDVLKRLLKEAVPVYLEASPIAALKRLRTEKRAVVTLTPDDEKTLLVALPPADQAIVLAALDTLARAGELLALRWADDHGRYLTILNPKAGESRKVPVSTRLRTALDALKKKRRKKVYIFAHRRQGETPTTWSNSVKQMLEDACRRTGITYGRKKEGITFHGLRHTGATRMIEAGVSLRIVQAIGGWSDLRLLTRYTHPSDAAMQDAVEAVSRAVSR